VVERVNADGSDLLPTPSTSTVCVERLPVYAASRGAEELTYGLREASRSYLSRPGDTGTSENGSAEVFCRRVRVPRAATFWLRCRADSRAGPVGTPTSFALVPMTWRP
jgi:hypothetical protein